MMRFLSSFLLSLLGWKIEGDYPHHEKKLVIVVMHHTSNWDFPLGLLLRSKLRFRANYVMKASMFRPPLGYIFKKLGGYPVERDPSKKKFSLTESIIELYQREEELTITFTPEGTRSKVRKLRSGFWIIAKTAGVPIFLVDFDFGTRTIRFDKPHLAEPTFAAEYDRLKAFYQHSKGLNPEKSFDFEDNDMVFPKE
jgi:1-acyl-sn-glycerol-3-phosphate acyltransferase